MQNNISQKPVVLTIAANDSAGMAGIAMDLKVQQGFWRSQSGCCDCKYCTK